MSLLVDQPAPQPQPARGRRRARRGSAILLTVGALMGGAAGAGALAATGALRSGGGSSSTTVVQRLASDGTTTSATSLNAGNVYASTGAGIVDITARSAQATATGSGFVLDSAGRIVTAAHVVKGATSITCKLQDGTSRTATVLGRDNATDVAVLKIDPSGLTLQPLKLGSSASLGVGQAIAAIGDPFNFDRSISTGIVSGLDRTIQAPNGFTVAHAIQTDAALNPGNSGGALADSSGRVVGVNTAVAGFGLGLAVPINTNTRHIISELMSSGRVRRAWLGVAGAPAPLPPQLAERLGQKRGLRLVEVVPGSPAAQAGLFLGDVLLTAGGRPVQGVQDVQRLMLGPAIGTRLAITVLRRGALVDVVAVPAPLD